MRSHAQGFTLLEVLIALAILALSLGVLLDAQVSSLANAGRARDLTIATLLARSKMIDIEKELFDKGFTTGTVEEHGDFGEETHNTIKWKYKVSEVQIDLSGLSSMCSLFSGESEKDSDKEKKNGPANESQSCESMLGSLGGPLTSLTDEIGRSVRTVELTVNWADGKYSQSLPVHALVTREDFNLVPPGALPPTGSPNPLQQPGLPPGTQSLIPPPGTVVR